MRLLSLCLFIFCLLPFPALGQVSVEGILETNQAYLGDQLAYKIKIDGVKGGVKIHIPKSPDFTLEQQGYPTQASQTTYINGKRTSFSGLVYDFFLAPLKAGNLEIPSIRVVIGGKAYFTRSFDLKVDDPRQFNEKQTVILTQRLAKKRYYIGERIELDLALLFLEDIKDYNLTLPILEWGLPLDFIANFAGAETVKLVSGKFKIPFLFEKTRIKGEDWRRLSQTLSFFPAQYGKVKILPAKIATIVHRGTKRERDFFGRLVRAPKKVRQFSETQSLSFIILPLPTQGRPKNFSRAVGHFLVESNSQFDSAQVGEHFYITLKIQGDGQLEQLKPPSLEGLGSDFEVLETWSTPEIEDRIAIYKALVKANKLGMLEIPSFSFSYFDPDLKQYQTIKTGPIPFEATSIKRLKTTEIADHRGENAQKSKALVLVKPNPWLFQTNWFWAYLLIPFVYVIGMRVKKENTATAIDPLAVAEEQLEKIKKSNQTKTEKERGLLALLLTLLDLGLDSEELTQLKTKLEARHYAMDQSELDITAVIKEIEILLSFKKGSPKDTSTVA